MSLEQIIKGSTNNPLNVQFNSVQVISGAAAGDILVSDANGNLTFETPATVPISIPCANLYMIQPQGGVNPDNASIASNTYVNMNFNNIVTTGTPFISAASGNPNFTLQPGTYFLDFRCSVNVDAVTLPCTYGLLLYNVTTNLPILQGTIAESASGTYTTYSTLNGIIVIGSATVCAIKHYVQFPNGDISFGTPFTLAGAPSSEIYSSYSFLKLA